MKPIINMNKCDGCGTCINACPESVLRMREITDDELKSLAFKGRLKVRIKGREKSFVIKPDGCIGCKKCEKVCHERAIEV